MRSVCLGACSLGAVSGWFVFQTFWHVCLTHFTNFLRLAQRNFNFHRRVEAGKYLWLPLFLPQASFGAMGPTTLASVSAEVVDKAVFFISVVVMPGPGEDSIGFRL